MMQIVAPQNGADKEVVIANSHRSTPPPSLELPSQNRSPPEDVADEALHPPDVDGMVLVEAANGDLSESEAIALTAAITPLLKGKTTLDKTKTVQFINAPGEVDRANERGSVAREVLNTWAPTRRFTNKCSGPDDTELMSKKDLPDCKRCARCVRRTIKYALGVGSQPPYRCFHCEDDERECIPYTKKDDQARRCVAIHALAESPQRRKFSALPPEDYLLGAVRRAMMRHNELVLAQLQVRKAEFKAHIAEHAHNLKVALERKRLADGRPRYLESWKAELVC